MDNLFTAIGGQAAVDAVVETFYRKVLRDERIGHFFEDVDMDRQVAKQRAFLTMAFGGPHRYSGRDLRVSHAPLVERGMDDSHVDAVIEVLGEALRDHGVAEGRIAQVVEIAESVRADVLNRSILGSSVPQEFRGAEDSQ